MAFVERKDFGVPVAGEKAGAYDEYITLSQVVAGSNIQIVRLANKDLQINATTSSGSLGGVGNFNLNMMSVDVTVDDFMSTTNHYMFTGTGHDSNIINDAIAQSGSSYSFYGAMMHIDITHNFDLSDIDNYVCFCQDITALAGSGFTASRLVMNKVVPVDSNTVRIWARRTGDNSLDLWKANSYYNTYNYSQRQETNILPIFRITILGGQ